MRDCAWVPGKFPNVRLEGFGCDSDRTDRSKRYNCIAWAAGDDSRRWWPSFEDRTWYWPPELPRARQGRESVDGFKAAFALFGYVDCESPDFEEGYEKIAIYTKENGRPTHAARSLRNRKWTSKLGDMEDVTHADPAALSGDQYGVPVFFMKRAFPGEQSTPQAPRRDPQSPQP